MKKRIARNKATLVAVSHVLFMAIVLASLPLAIVYEWYRPFAFLLVTGTVLVWVITHDCPLTILENHYRAQAGVEKISPNFISYHLRKELRKKFSTWIVLSAVYTWCAAIAAVAIV